MSDRRSVPPSFDGEAKKEAAANLVDLNSVLQRLLQQLDAGIRFNLVLRCDHLPQLPGNEADWEAVFSGLLQMIFQKKKDVTKLFLHIHCTSHDAGNSFEIQFNTNISPCHNWMQAHKVQLTRISNMLKKHKGNLVVNQVKASGSIFSVSLPGKNA